MNNTCEGCKFYRVYYHGFQYNHIKKKREAVFSEICLYSMKVPVIKVGNEPIYKDCKYRQKNENHNE